MDGDELLAYGRQHRANADSVEYREAQAEYKRRQQSKKETKIAPPTNTPTSEELIKMAAEAPPGAYPWKRY